MHATSSMEITARNQNEVHHITLRVTDGTKVIKAKAFQSCNWFNTVIIPEGVSKIEDEAFSNCQHLERLVIPSTLLEIGTSAFTDCLKLDNLELKNVQIVGRRAFAGCLNLTSVDIPHVEVVCYRAFYMCQKLESVTNATNVHFVQKEAFAHAGHITLVTFGEPLISIDNGAFKYSGIHFVALQDSTELKSIGNGAFENCELLMGVQFAPQTNVKIIKTKTFRNCSDLFTINLPEGITTISSNTFQNSSIREVTFPTTLKKIARRAFDNCSNLRIPILSSHVYVDWTSFLGCRPCSPFEYPGQKHTQMDLSGEQCSICISKFEYHFATCTFGCGHVFHTECAKEWYEKANTCANCRQEVKQVEVVQRPTKRIKIM